MRQVQGQAGKSIGASGSRPVVLSRVRHGPVSGRCRGGDTGWRPSGDMGPQAWTPWAGFGAGHGSGRWRPGRCGSSGRDWRGARGPPVRCQRKCPSDERNEKIAPKQLATEALRNVRKLEVIHWTLTQAIKRLQTFQDWGNRLIAELLEYLRTPNRNRIKPSGKIVCPSLLLPCCGRWWCCNEPFALNSLLHFYDFSTGNITSEELEYYVCLL